MESGRLSNKVYYRYFREGGNIIVLITMIIIYILSQIATSGADYWLSYWTNLETIRNKCGNSSKNNCSVSEFEYKSMVNNTFFQSLSLLDGDGFLSTKYAVHIYTGCIVGCIVLTTLRSFFFMHVCMNAGRKLHNHMFSNVLQATMNFFHTNPSGNFKLLEAYCINDDAKLHCVHYHYFFLFCTIILIVILYFRANFEQIFKRCWCNG